MTAFIQVTVGGEAMGQSFRLEANCDPDELNATLDTMTKAIGRQDTKQRLAQRILDLRNEKLWLASWPEPKTAVAKVRMVERENWIRQWQQAHESSGKRLDFKLSGQHQAHLATFDKETENQLKKLDETRNAKLAMIPLIEQEIEMLRAVFNGADQVEINARDTDAIQLPAAAD